MLDFPRDEEGTAIKDKVPEIELRSNCLQSFHIVGAIYEAFDLNSLQSSGATFIFPTSLSDYQWTLLKGFSSGKNKAENEDRKKKKKD